MNRVFPMLRGIARWSGACLLVAVPFVSTTPASAQSGPGPGGVNIGFNFNWAPGPPGLTASFINVVSNSGATLNNCASPFTSGSQSCDFAFTFTIGGVPQTGVSPGSSYQTWNGVCDPGNSDTQPLTLFNCFNVNSFGQIFYAGSTGALSGITMQMTCLNPAGGALTGLIAVLYQVNPASGGSIPATPLAQTPVDLSTCPTLTSWTGHTFSLSDFANIPLNFSSVNVTTGNFYGVYFAGLVPGTPPPGFGTTPASVPTLSPWNLVALAVTLLAAGIWKLRGQWA